MDKEYLKQLISVYLDGETTQEETDLVVESLAKDPELKKYYQELKSLSTSLYTVPDQTLSPDCERNINQKLIKQKDQEGIGMKIWDGYNSLKRVGVFMFLLAFVGGVVLPHMYRQRSLQGRRRSGIMDIGDQYYPGKSGPVQYVKSEQAQSPAAAPSRQPTLSAALQHEPYYLKSDYAVKRPKVSTPAVNRAFQVAKGTTMASLEMLAPTEAAPQKVVRSRMKRIASGMINALGGKAAETAIWPKPPVPDGQDWNTEQYDRIYENQFLAVTDNPLSTFSIDVDTASYSNLRRFLNTGQMPPEDAVRIEEMINYFSYDYPEPTGQDPFSITTEVSPCPWNHERNLVLIGLQGKRLKGTEMPPSNLVFLIDVSGSMDNANKLPLLKSAYSMMVQQLRKEDTISIVVYAGAAGKVLEPTSGDQKQTILNAIQNLKAGGSTAGGAGIKLAYELAKANFIKDGNNRVVLATDGDFNVGVSSNGELVRIIEEKRKDGIFLTILGFGTGNYKDARMEQLADKGNGNYYYIDTIKEAKKVLVKELGSALFTIAKDVKLQVEFNPNQIKAYRLIGYENRVLAKEDFNDDTKDAGELGTGHSVTALYEIVPADSKETFGQVDPLKYQSKQVNKSDELLTVKLRYKKPDEDTSKLLSQVIQASQVTAQMSPNLSWAASVAEFGLILRNSEFKGDATYQSALTRAQAAKGQDQWGYRQEMIDLLQKAQSLDVRNLNPQGGIGTK